MAADGGGPKPRWEQLLRLRVLRAGRHCTANDRSRSILLFAGALLFASAVMLLLSGGPLRYGFSGFAASLGGLALQQYSHYTVHTRAECWAAEGGAVTAIVLFSSLLLGFFSLLLGVLLPGRALKWIVLGIFHAAMLTCHRWAPWGSLFDGHEKSSEQKSR